MFLTKYIVHLQTLRNNSSSLGVILKNGHLFGKMEDIMWVIPVVKEGSTSTPSTERLCKATKAGVQLTYDSS